MSYISEPERIDNRPDFIQDVQDAYAPPITEETPARELDKDGQDLKSEVITLKADWRITERDAEGNIIDSHEFHNTIMNLGRAEVLKLMFNLSGSPFIAMGVGASAHPTDPEDPDQTRLQYELIADSTRKALSDKLGGSLTSADIETEIVDIGDNNAHTAEIYVYRKLVMTALYDTTDPNNGNSFKEYALFSTLTLPGTPTSTSGVMLNRFEDPFPIFKHSGNAITAEVTIRL